MYRMAQKKVDHHAVCEHNLHKLLLNDALISRDDKKLILFAILFMSNILCEVIHDGIDKPDGFD